MALVAVVVVALWAVAVVVLWFRLRCVVFGGRRAVCRCAVQPGVTPDEIDAAVHDKIVSLGAYPAPLNYYGFPKSICSSPNQVICHGIPDTRPLRWGDILKLDVSVFAGGFFGDCCGTFAVGGARAVDAAGRNLIFATKRSLAAAIAICRDGERLNRIGETIQCVSLSPSSLLPLSSSPLPLSFLSPSPLFPLSLLSPPSLLPLSVLSPSSLLPLALTSLRSLHTLSYPSFSISTTLCCSTIFFFPTLLLPFSVDILIVSPIPSPFLVLESSCTYVCVRVCMNVRMYAHMYVFVFVCVYVCMYACLCTYVCMCVCTFVLFDW